MDIARTHNAGSGHILQRYMGRSEDKCELGQRDLGDYRN